MSGNVVYQQEFEKSQIPTFSSIRNKTWSVMVDNNLISRQQTLRLILSNGEEPCARAKVWKKTWQERLNKTHIKTHSNHLFVRGSYFLFLILRSPILCCFCKQGQIAMIFWYFVRFLGT